MDVVSAVGPSSITIRTWVDVRLGGEKPGVGVRVYDSSSRDTYRWIDVGTCSKIRLQERSGQVPGSHDVTVLGMNLVDIVQCSGDVNILDAIRRGIDQW